MQNILKLLFVLSFVFKIDAQEQIPVQVVCLDIETEALIKEVEITLNPNSPSKKALIHSDSIAFLVDKEYGVVSFELKAKKEGYHVLDTLIKLPLSDQSNEGQKVQQVTIYLKYDGGTTQAFNVQSTYTPDIIFASDTFSVADFEIDHAGNMFLLTYSKRLSKGSLLVHYDYEKQLILEKRPINFSVISIKRDYRGKLFLEGEESMYYILKTSRITLHKLEKEYFENYIAPIVDTTEEEIFFTNYSPYYPAFDYFGVTLKDTVYRDLAHIVDSEIMELYLAEYKYVDVRTKLWAWDMERSTGVDREVWVGAQNFVNSIYYEPAYGPLYKKNDTLYIFDHYKNRLYKVDPFGSFEKDSCDIVYHLNPRKTGWKKNMIQDELTENIYCYFDKAGYVTLKEVNTDNGTLENDFKLYHRYVEKVRVINGEVYYIYRPFESIQKKYLYKEFLSMSK
jgi:hypothetical protein